MKDPAFLFYSKDFYEGTRTMLPTERACFIDLLIFQHQHGLIPNDIVRISMYCSGIDEATLEAKFKLTSKGWINEKLEKVILDRKEFSSKQSINGQVGQFWKKSKSLLSSSQNVQLRELLHKKRNAEILKLLKGKEINEATLKALIKHLAIVNENVIEDDSIKESMREKINFSDLENTQWFETILRYVQLKINYEELQEYWNQFQEGMVADDDLYYNINQYYCATARYCTATSFLHLTNSISFFQD